MRMVLNDGRRFVLRFDAGEEVMSGLVNFAAGNKIDAAVFEGIGACDFAVLAHYDPKTGEYSKREFKEELEITSLIGNIALLESKPVFHCHGTFAKTDFSCIGGHVLQAVISATCEIFLIALDGQLARQKDSQTNLNLLV